MSMTLERARALELEAKKNGGRCTNCEQQINIYVYGISRTMVKVLRVMAASKVEHRGDHAIDVEDLGLKHSERTQLTKMRFHGLVAKYKDDGKQIPRHWLITTKGWQFLGRETVQEKVVVLNNQVLGHEGDLIAMKRVDGEADDIEQRPVTEAEARTYSNVRVPVKNQVLTCEYVGKSHTATGHQTGDTVELTIERMQVGRPIKVLKPLEGEYRDIAAFAKKWKVVE